MSEESTEPKTEEPAVEPAPEPKENAPEWKYKSEFGINTRMREVIELTISVCNAEIASNRRKIEKLTYGV